MAVIPEPPPVIAPSRRHSEPAERRAPSAAPPTAAVAVDPVAAFDDVQNPVDQETPEVSSSELLEEVNLIDRSRKLLSSGQAAAALSELSTHSKKFPGGRLRPEAMFLRMRAQLMLGRQAQAERTAANILKWYPNGPHAGRAREVLSR